MDILSAILLGFIQGLTEFLPVSSSGHLVIVQSLLPGFFQPGVLFDAVLHLGTLLAVLIYFRRTLLSLDKHLILLLLVGSIPAGLAGVLLKDLFEKMFSDPKTVGIELIITGFINLLIDIRENKGKSIAKTNLIDSLSIGIFQAIAIIPGISRSGATIFGGILRGIDKKDAASFSFLLSIPAIGGAAILEIKDYGISTAIAPAYLVGTIVAFIVGYLSIDVLLKLLTKRYFKIFAIYCWVVGGVVLLLNL